MVDSRHLQPSDKSFGSVFIYNQFRAQPQWPASSTDLSGKTAIVTGSNTGLGYEAARQLLNLKVSRLILGVRSPEKGEAAAAQLREPHPKANVEVWQLDMKSYDSVQTFARRADSELPHIDYVLLNAGAINMKFSVVKSTGHVECMQVNYISTMLLALLFLPILKAKRSTDGQAPHLTIVSAALTLAAKFPNRNANPLLPSFDDPKIYNPMEHYNSSKLLAHMFLWKLVDYVSADDVIVNLADPAWVRGTELGRDASGVVMKLGYKVFALTGRTKKVGASCFIDALVNKGEESHGCFLMSWNIHPFAAFLYTPEGKEVTERVWKETLNELDFANLNMPSKIDIVDVANSASAYFSAATRTLTDSRHIFISGQVGATRKGHVPADYESQIQLALLNLHKVLITAGTTINGIAKLTLYIVNYDPAHRKHVGHIQRFLRSHRPSITLVPVTQLAAPDWLFEIEAVAVCTPSLGTKSRGLQEVSNARWVDVAIIGAGLAGLSAGEKIKLAGHSYAILEARDRVGGKLWSHATSGRKGFSEYGAAWTNDVNQTMLFALVKRFGLEVIEQNTEGDCVFQGFDGASTTFPYGELPKFDQETAKDVARIRDICETDCQSLSVFEPENTQLDAMNFEAYLRTKNASQASIATATVWTRAMLGVDPADISALFFLNYCKSGGGLLQMRSDRRGGGQHLRIRQGTQSIARRLAAALSPGSIRLNTTVKDVIQDSSGTAVVLSEDGVVYRARRVITTVPSPVLKTINFEPELSRSKQAWSESASYGFYVKAIVAFRTAFWIEKGLCGLCQSFVGPASIVRDTSSPADKEYALTCFMAGAPGQQWVKLSAIERQQSLLDQLGILFNDKYRVQQDFVGMEMFDWGQDKFTGGGCPCASLPPGLLDTLGPAALRQPWGNLHFAGTETAGEWKGYMEGAVRSGERAATEVLNAFADNISPRL
ncbi:hypothetical protein DV736_g4507, partial [Chaetothyriales sp. CBS 134916]